MRLFVEHSFGNWRRQYTTACHPTLIDERFSQFAGYE